MEYLVTFLEGVITFVSPCLLPMLPLYVAYFAGGAGEAAAASKGGEGEGPGRDGQGVSRLRRTVRCALGFIVGFTVLFTVLGAFAGGLGSLAVQHQGVLNVACGAIVIVLGLNYLGVLRIPFLQRTFKVDAGVVPRGFFSSLVFGMVFAIGWTPCVGAFLGSALSMAASTGSTLEGVCLLLCYSLGLGLPFFVAAVLIDQLEGAFTWIKAHYGIIDRVCGALLVVVGVLMASGLFGYWLRALSL